MSKSSAAAYQKNSPVKQLPCEITVPPGRWRRASAGKDGKIGRPELSTEQILRALVGTHAHRGRVWSTNDQETHDEVGHRSWRWLELQQRRFNQIPGWLSPAIAHARFWPLLGMLVASYRAGAIGVLLSYEEGAAYFGISRRTWARWVKQLSEAGLVRIVPTWLEASSEGRGRDRGRNLYQVGAELERVAGPGLMEGLGEGSLKRWRGRMAAAARKKAKRARHDALTVAWAAQREVDAAEPATAPEPSQAASEGGAQEAVRSAAGSQENSKGSAILAPHSPPGRASLGSDPVGVVGGPSAPEKERALRARGSFTSGPDQGSQRRRRSSAATSTTRRDPDERTAAPGNAAPAANDVAVAPGRGASAVPPPGADTAGDSTAAAPPDPCARLEPSPVDVRREPSAKASRQPSATPAKRKPSPEYLRLKPVPPAEDASAEQQLSLAELDDKTAAEFFGSVRSTQTTFWRDLPRRVLDTWGVSSDVPVCSRCAGHGHLGTKWDAGRERIVEVTCERCNGSGNEPG